MLNALTYRIFMKKLTGRVWKYGDNVNTDVIFPGKYTYTVKDKKEMALHAFEDLDPSFAENVKSGDVVVAGDNFGCGSSREQAAFALKYAGVSAVIARSFARLYFRNAINAGLFVITCSEAYNAVKKNDEVEIDLESFTIKTPDGTFLFPPLNKDALAIIEDGGLIPHTKKILGKGEKNA
jgi:3-isopropylmalate/(R)-2-methylmalate dehydratase small subunit